MQCLRKDAESRRRELHIRTYAVIPLNEECGIIEWVNNTAGLRHILTKLYKERGALTCEGRGNECGEKWNNLPVTFLSLRYLPVG